MLPSGRQDDVQRASHHRAGQGHVVPLPTGCLSEPGPCRPRAAGTFGGASGRAVTRPVSPAPAASSHQTITYLPSSGVTGGRERTGRGHHLGRLPARAQTRQLAGRDRVPLPVF